MLRQVRSSMEDRSLLRTVLSLVVNVYTLYEVQGQAAAQEAAPANF